jgi:hypothetical protein
MIDRGELMVRAAAWMRGRGWKRRVAKRREYEVSLFEYSLIEGISGMPGFAARFTRVDI